MGTVRDPSSRRRFAQIVLRFVTERSGTRPCPAAPVGSEEPGSINVSAAAATRPELFDLLCRNDSSARLVVVELTEQTDVSDCPALIQSLAAMHERGIRIAVDGTGAGFASLRHLLNLRPEFVKLDIYLVRNVDADPARRALAAGLLTFTQEIGAVLVAEGIESEEELLALRRTSRHGLDRRVVHRRQRDRCGGFIRSSHR